MEDNGMSDNLVEQRPRRWFVRRCSLCIFPPGFSGRQWVYTTVCSASHHWGTFTSYRFV